MRNELAPDATEMVAIRVGYKNARRYRARIDFVFQNMPVTDCRILDVGCGRGAMSFWAALAGASYVLGIEPERHGATSGTSDVFEGLITDLGLDTRVELRRSTLEELEPTDARFDLAILYNVINHIDEKSVTKLHSDRSARASYIQLLLHLRSLLTTGATVIVADCGRKNFWNRLGLSSPFASSIEWDKHQEPEQWAQLFEQCGFVVRDVRWSYLYPFRRLTANRAVNYLTASHFVMRLQAVEDPPNI